MRKGIMSRADTKDASHAEEVELTVTETPAISTSTDRAIGEEEAVTALTFTEEMSDSVLDEQEGEWGGSRAVSEVGDAASTTPGSNGLATRGANDASGGGNGRAVSSTSPSAAPIDEADAAELVS